MEDQPQYLDISEVYANMRQLDKNEMSQGIKGLVAVVSLFLVYA
jgi:hypothetical protein